MKLQPFWSLLKATALEWWNDNVFRLAASLAFYTVFSIAPILVIAVWLAGAIFGEDAAARQVVAQITSLVGAEGGHAVEQILRSAHYDEARSLAALWSLVLLIVGSTVVFAELQAALNVIWDVQADPARGAIRGFVRGRLLSLAVVLGVGFLLLVSLLVSAGLAAAQEYITDLLPGVAAVWRLLHLIVSFAIITLLFAMIYKILPDVRIIWRDVAVGAAVTAVLFSIGKYAIGAYLGQMSVGSAYGAAGSFAVLLIWVYYSALVCFFGAEFTQVFARRFGSGIHPQRHAVRIGHKPDRI